MLHAEQDGVMTQQMFFSILCREERGIYRKAMAAIKICTLKLC